MSLTKKFISVLLTVLVAVSCILPAAQPAQAADDISIYVNGSYVESSQPPVIQDGRTLVPLRPIFAALGCEILWDGSNDVIAAYDPETNRVVCLMINEKNLFCADYSEFQRYESDPTSQAAIDFVLSNSSQIDVPAQLIGGSTMVPVRVISETLGATVVWNGQQRTVTVTR